MENNLSCFLDIKFQVPRSKLHKRGRSSVIAVTPKRRQDRQISFLPIFYKNHDLCCSKFECLETICGPTRLKEVFSQCRALQSGYLQPIVSYMTWENIIREGKSKTSTLVKKKTPMIEFLDIFFRALPKLSLHEWQLRHDKFMRDLCLHTMITGTLILYCDFSAKYECKGMSTATSQHDHSVTQLVIMVHYLKDEKITTECVHCWGGTEYKIDQNAAFYFACLDKIVPQFKCTLGINRLFIFTDGCSSQFKGGTVMHCLSTRQRKWDVIDVVATTAPTAGFKCQVDLNGHLMKRALWKEEKKNNRLHNAWLVYKFISKQIITSPNTTLAIHRVSKRHHYFVCSTWPENGISLENMQNIILLDNAKFYKDFPTEINLPGIRLLHQFRVSSQQFGATIIHVRQHACWCRSCVSGVWDECPRHLSGESKWETKFFTPHSIAAKIDFCKGPYNKESPPIIGFHSADRDVVSFAKIIGGPQAATNNSVAKALSQVKSLRFAICKEEYVIEAYVLTVSKIGYITGTLSDNPMLLPVRCTIIHAEVSNHEDSTKYIKLQDKFYGQFIPSKTKTAYLSLNK